MKKFFKKAVLVLMVQALVMGRLAFSASPTPALLKAKQESEAKGYIFFANHDEIVAEAKKEGKLKVMTGLDPANHKPLIEAFKQEYPFIADIHLEELSSGAYQRFLLEMKAGRAKEWDTAHITLDFAQEYPPYLKKYDILSLAEHGVLKIDPRMIHPSDRNMVSVTSNLSVMTYNRKLISEDKIPANWEDFLKPEFEGSKFVVDIRPLGVAGLVPAWGLERTLDFARKLAAQHPVWGSGAPRINTGIAVGEHALGLSSSLSSVKRAMSKDPTGSLNYKLGEPVPTMTIYHANGILNTAGHPYAALLWFEFLASPEGQEIIDKYAFIASVFTPGSITAQVTRGKELSVVDWNHFTKFQEYQVKIFAAYGFPNADK